MTARKTKNLLSPAWLATLTQWFWYERLPKGTHWEAAMKAAKVLAEKLVTENPPWFDEVVTRYRARAGPPEIEGLFLELKPKLLEYGRKEFPGMLENETGMY